VRVIAGRDSNLLLLRTWDSGTTGSTTLTTTGTSAAKSASWCGGSACEALKLGLPPTQKPLPLPPPKVPERREIKVLRIVRDTIVSRRVKELHDFSCQVCGLRLIAPTGPYAEGAHVRPLGSPHNGPDALENILCLCQITTCCSISVVFTVADDLALIGLPGKLRKVKGHEVNAGHLAYHRSHYGPAD